MLSKYPTRKYTEKIVCCPFSEAYLTLSLFALLPTTTLHRMIDTLATQKYYHFVRLMGRAASNIALEVALQTQPNICLISEEVEAKNMSLVDVSKSVAQVIQDRAEQGKNYGVVLLPEGLIEFIPEFSRLIQEMNDLMAADSSNSTEEALLANLSAENKLVFEYLPAEFRAQLCLDRDPHGNVQVVRRAVSFFFVWCHCFCSNVCLSCSSFVSAVQD